MYGYDWICVGICGDMWGYEEGYGGDMWGYNGDIWGYDWICGDMCRDMWGYDVGGMERHTKYLTFWLPRAAESSVCL